MRKREEKERQKQRERVKEIEREGASERKGESERARARAQGRPVKLLGEYDDTIAVEQERILGILPVFTCAHIYSGYT